jgi:hypothetical protein
VVDNFVLPDARVCVASEAVGGAAYFPTKPDGVVHRLDVDDGEVSEAARIDANVYVWSLEAAPDGTLYAGTSHNSRVYEIDPESGSVGEIGPIASSEKFAYDLVATDAHVYVGVGNTENSGLYRIDRKTHDVTQLFRDEFTEFVFKIRQNDRYFAAYLRDSERTAIVDRRSNGLADERVDHYVDGPLPPDWALGRDGLPSNRLYYPARPSQVRNWPEDDVHDTSGPALYAYDLDSRDRSRLFEIGGAAYNDRSNHVVDGSYVAVRSSGSAAIVDVEAETSAGYPLAGVGMDQTAGTNQGIGQYRGNPVTARRGALFVHDVSAGTRQKVRFGGEAKRMVEADDRLYLAKYPGAVFKVYDGSEVKTLGEADGQLRPYDLEHNPTTSSVLMGTQPNSGVKSGGAVAILDLERGEVTTHENVVEDQSIYSITPAGETIYVGGGTNRGGGTQPVTDAGKLAKFDEPTMEKHWELVPVEGANTVWDLEYDDGRVVGIADSTAFSVDTETQTVEDTVDLGLVPFFNRGPDGRLYGVANRPPTDSDAAGGLLRIDDGSLSIEHFQASGVFCFAAENTLIGESVFYVDTGTWNLMEIERVPEY